MSFENVKVVVTGGAKGIGGACVKAFTEGGQRFVFWTLIKPVKNSLIP